MVAINLNDESVNTKIEQLIQECGGTKDAFESDLIKQQIKTSLRLLTEGHNIGQLKLMTRAMKELRYAYRIFNDYPGTRRISFFGSARTPEDHPDYTTAHRFSEELAKINWMSITGGANGIMKAGMAGSVHQGSFGLSIRLPFEVPTNTYIEGDPKLIYFRYFFTRKLMFMSHSDALAVFPGGFGTQDELFEMLTLIQTGRGNIIPIVLMEAPEGVYWKHWLNYLEKNLFDNRWVCPEDRSLFYIAPTVEAGIEHVTCFYKRYHSSRYVRELMVMRINEALTDDQLNELNSKFSRLVATGKIEQSEALPEEEEFMEKPRLVFHHTRMDFGLLRQMIDAINDF
jgi:uncharacterized protein (TIGR00730 family)